MTHPDTIRDEVKLIGFDVYDTLLPYEQKFIPAFEAYFDENDLDRDPLEMYATWKSKLFYYMNVNTIVNEPRQPIIEVGHRALRAVFDEGGIEYSAQEIRDLVGTWKTLEPHDDVVEAFERLGEEYTLVGLSNGDPDMLAAIRPGFEGTLDDMLSSAYAGIFKPAPEVYELLIDRFDVAAHEVLYAAAHDFDIVGPQHVGMYACFVERVDPYGDWENEPDLWVEDIAELADTLL